MQNSIRITALVLWLPALSCGALAEDLPGPESQTVSAVEPLFEPVSLSADDATIQMTMTGSYRGGFFADKSPSEPVYDPYTQRLLVPTQIASSLEVLVISDPYFPTKVDSIDLTLYGGEVENAAIHEGVVAVVVQDGTGESTLSNVLLMNVEGTLLADPIQLETASGIAFTPHGWQLVVTQSGRPADDYSEDPEGKVAVIFLGFPNWKQCRKGHVAACGIHPHVRVADFTAYNGREQELQDMGIRITIEGASAAQDLRPSALAVADDTRYAYVTLQLNNAIAVIDLWFARVVDLLPLGMRDNSLLGNGFDASDKDNAINIRNWPVLGMYMPDGVATSGRGRNTLLYTSNEGDLLDEDYMEEEVEIAEAALDPVAFPNFEMLQADENLGRLRVSSISSDEDGDGVFDKLVMGGTRSFSIWTRDGQHLFDSGDEFEQVLKQAVPACFNSPEDECKFDDRSPRKGPEPEYVTVGDIEGRKYLFIGFERMAGAIAYDVTDPHNAKFQQYFNNRNFAVDPHTVCGDKGKPAMEGCEIAGDLEVEGLMFIPAEDSPIGVPLLVLAHELSDSTSILRIDTVHN